MKYVILLTCGLLLFTGECEEKIIAIFLSFVFLPEKFIKLSFSRSGLSLIHANDEEDKTNFEKTNSGTGKCHFH